MDEKTDFEKLIDSAAQLATVVRAYYKSLTEEGFTEEQAFKMSIEYQNSIMNMAGKK